MRYSHIEHDSVKMIYGDFTWTELIAELATHYHDEITAQETEYGFQIVFRRSDREDTPMGYCIGIYLQLEKDGTFLAGPIPALGGDS